MNVPFGIRTKLALSTLSIVLVLSGCSLQGRQPESAGAGARTPPSKAELALSKYDPPVEVSFVREMDDNLRSLISQFPGETLEDNRWTRLYEQVLGIKIKYDWTATGDLYRQKLGVALASGDLPDVVKVDEQQLRQLSDSGKIQDLTDAYNEYASKLTKQILSQEGSGPFDRATIDGKLMAIPQTDSSIEGAQFIWIRNDWLKRLGLKPPRTMSDVLAISKAFTELDPDQNGMKDTFGLAVTSALWDPVEGLGGFMAGYGAYPNIWIKDKSGKLVYGGIQPEVRTALKTLQDMYREGQIDPEFGIETGTNVTQRIADGKIGMFYGEQWASFVAQSSLADDAKADWRAFPLVSASGAPPKVPLRFRTYQYFAVRKDFPHPEAVVKMFNLHLEKNWGKTAEYNTYYSTPMPVWEFSPVTPFPARKNLDAFLQVDRARRTGDTSGLNDEAKSILRNINAYLQNGDPSGWGWERTYGFKGAYAILGQYEQNRQLLYESFTGAPTETMLEKQGILNKLQDDTFVNIILGRPIGNFDEFVREWNRLGGAEITKEVNDWYSTKAAEQQ